jgi:hypothetical protein
MLATLAATALIAGGGRYWYDLQVRPSRAEALVLGSLEFRDVDPRLSIEAPAWWKLPPRVVHLWFDDAADFEGAAVRLGELTAVESVQVLGRQIVPHAEAFQRDGSDRVIDAWRRHPTLREVLVDASVRGAPLADEVELYDRDDLETLRSALPGVKIVWMEVH